MGRLYTRNRHRKSKLALWITFGPLEQQRAVVHFVGGQLPLLGWHLHEGPGRDHAGREYQKGNRPDRLRRFWPHRREEDIDRGQPGPQAGRLLLGLPGPRRHRRQRRLRLCWPTCCQTSRRARLSEQIHRCRSQCLLCGVRT